MPSMCEQETLEFGQSGHPIVVMAFGWTHLMENRTVPRLCNSWKIELLLPLYHYLMFLGSVLWFFGHEYCMTCSSSRYYREQQPFKLWRHCLQHGTSQIHDPRIFTLFSYTNQSIHANFPSSFFFSFFFFFFFANISFFDFRPKSETLQ